MTRHPKPASNEPAIRVVMMPKDTNAEGTIFGGVILSLMDQAAYIEAMRQAHHKYVTVSFNKVEFKKPVYVGDVLSLYSDTTRIGRTSMSILVRVRARRRINPDENVEVTQGELVFVAVDDAGKPVAIIEK
ncbi:MAG: acyl-CoA thioesterase [Phycisphaerae bacterium]